MTIICKKTGLEPQNWTFYEVFGVFRLAVIAQQIYYRYYHKQTRNPAFKDFWIVIHALHMRALKLIAQQKLQESEFAQQSLQKNTGYFKKMTTIYLVRHGQASFGKSNYDELSENGEAQATLLGQYFKKILKEQPYIVAGTMQRHEQTAQLALKRMFSRCGNSS